MHIRLENTAGLLYRVTKKKKKIICDIIIEPIYATYTLYIRTTTTRTEITCVLTTGRYVCLKYRYTVNYNNKRYLCRKPDEPVGRRCRQLPA